MFEVVFLFKAFLKCTFFFTLLSDKRICLQSVSLTVYKTLSREFPGSGVVGIPCFHCKNGEKKPHKSCGKAKKKKKPNKKPSI